MQGIGMRRPGTLAAAACAALLLAACEGIFTGKEVATTPLEPDPAGGYKPVTVKLTTEMSPVSLNFHAEQGNFPSETGKWNAYRATLSRAGQAVVTRDFNVSYTGVAELQPPAHPEHVITMMIYRVEASGEYEVSIKPAKAVEVTLQNPRLEVRRNVQAAQ